MKFYIVVLSTRIQINCRAFLKILGRAITVCRILEISGIAFGVFKIPLDTDNNMLKKQIKKNEIKLLSSRYFTMNDTDIDQEQPDVNER